MFEIKHKQTHAVLAQIDCDSLAGRKMFGARCAANLAGADLRRGPGKHRPARRRFARRESYRGTARCAYLDGAGKIWCTPI